MAKKTQAPKTQAGAMRAQQNTPLGDEALETLVTVRDWLRAAVSRFEAAGLVYGHGTASALDEAAFLILHTLHLPIDQLEPWLDARLLGPERAALRNIVEARIATRKPAPYLTGEAWIGGHRFHVDERVIVPRSFIGELLAATTEGDILAGLIDDPTTLASILDLCTGSGCLAILAAHAFPDAVVDAVDLSLDALEVARRNVTEHGFVERVSLYEGDLFAPLAAKRYDLIVSNPPYVDAAAMAALPPEYAHEPVLALAAGEDGLTIVRQIIDQAGRFLAPGGGLLLEIGRCRPQFETAFPALEPLWLDTATSTGEVLWLTADRLAPGTSHAARARTKKS